MVKFIINCIFCFIFLLNLQKGYGQGHCHLDVNRDISDYSPLFLESDGTQFLRSRNTQGVLEIKEDDRILVACPGSDNRLVIKVNGRSIRLTREAVITCRSGNEFKFPNNELHSSRNIRCAQWPQSEIRAKASYSYSICDLYEEGFRILARFVPLFEFCFDSQKLNTLYTRFSLAREAKYGQGGQDRPPWKATKTLYGNLKVDNLYKRQSQRKTIQWLLGSPTLADKYIHKSGDYFLSRGHLVAKADFFFKAQQMNTFVFENAAPQWQTSNGGNWNEVEIAVREKAAQLGQDLEIYTGTFGNDVLRDEDERKVQLSLNYDGKIPVPMMYWKIVYDTSRNLGVAIIVFNSPYITSGDIDTNKICPDICSKISWLHRFINENDKKNIRKGYVFCCEVNEFKKVVNYLPDFRVNGILN